VSGEPTARLSGEQVTALKFAVHRQLARWANKPRLSEYQRLALKGAVRVLQDPVFSHGCELRVPDTEEDRDG